MTESDKKFDDIVYGRNPVSELLRSDANIDVIYLSDKKGPLGKIFAEAKGQGLPVKEAKAEKLAALSGSKNHQGVVAILAAVKYKALSDLFAIAKERGEPPFFVICDEIEDPHNLGAIIRSAEGAGAHGVIIPKRRSAGVNATVRKTSAGATEHMAVAKVSNLASAVDELKARGVFVYCADMEGELWCDVDFSGPAALIVGNEGKGISQLLRKKSDVKVRLPMCGQVESLNVSAAASVLLYEITRGRLKGRE